MDSRPGKPIFIGSQSDRGIHHAKKRNRIGHEAEARLGKEAWPFDIERDGSNVGANHGMICKVRDGWVKEAVNREVGLRSVESGAWTTSQAGERCYIQNRQQAASPETQSTQAPAECCERTMHGICSLKLQRAARFQSEVEVAS
jgi:hypothetical protein